MVHHVIVLYAHFLLHFLLFVLLCFIVNENRLWYVHFNIHLTLGVHVNCAHLVFIVLDWYNIVHPHVVIALYEVYATSEIYVTKHYNGHAIFIQSSTS